MSERRDAHRPSVMDPTEYLEVLPFCYGSSTTPRYNVDRLIEMRRTETFFRKESETGGCDLCGAKFAEGSVFRHVSTGEHIVVGHQCADKVGFHRDLELRAEARSVALRQRERIFNRQLIRKALAEEPELRELFRCRHEIARDIRGRFVANAGACHPTPKQVELLRKLRHKETNPETEAPKVPAPSGKIEVRGRVISSKEHEGPYGARQVMTVRVETLSGVWLAWGTVPDVLLDGRELVGSEVSFSASVTVSDRDPSFAFFKRPTKARRVE